jgi:tRNA (uracil-5-)-methyltransferase
MDMTPDANLTVNDAPVQALFVPPTASSSTPTVDHPSVEADKPPRLTKQPKVKQRKQKRILPEAFSPADVLFHDVRDFLGEEYVNEVIGRKDASEWAAPEELKLWEVVELRVGAFCVNGGSRCAWLAGQC